MERIWLKQYTCLCSRRRTYSRSPNFVLRSNGFYNKYQRASLSVQLQHIEPNQGSASDRIVRNDLLNRNWESSSNGGIHTKRALSFNPDSPGGQTPMSAAPSMQQSGGSTGTNSSTSPKIEVKVKPAKPKFDYNVTKTDRNYISPIRAMRIYHLDEKSLADLPLCLRRSAFAGDSPVMKVYNIRDVEKKALKIHGSLEKIAELESERLQEEDNLKHLKFVYNRAKRRFKQTKNALLSDEKVSGTSSNTKNSIAHKSLNVVKVAVLVNSINAVGKFIACALTGSSAMFAEAVHSCADTMNQCILLVGKLQSSQEADENHPYGYQNLQNISALISGCGVFCIGSGLSFYHGVSMLLHPAPVTNLPLSFSILAFALLTEGTSLTIAYRHLRAEAKKSGVNFISYIRRSNDPAVNLIFCEDIAAVTGIFIAATTTALTYCTEMPVFDATGSIGVGTLLAFVSGYIITTNSNVLLGQSVSMEQMRQMRAILERDRMVRGLHDVKATTVGGTIRFKAEADFDGREITSAYISTKVDLDTLLKEVREIGDLRALEQFMLTHGEGVIDQLGEEVDRLEKKLKNKHPSVRHVDLEVL